MMPMLSAGVFCMYILYAGKGSRAEKHSEGNEYVRTIEDGEIKVMSGNQLRLPADGGNQLST